MRCGYRVTVENAGPGSYNGDIAVDETIPPGTTPIFSGPGWLCPGAGNHYTCTFSGANLPNPGNSVSFFVRLDFTKAQAEGDELQSPQSRQDHGGAWKHAEKYRSVQRHGRRSRDRSGRHLQRPPEANLRITKRAAPVLQRSGDDWWCSWAIRVWNMGPAKYVDPIEVEEALPGQPVDASWNAPWNCTGLGGDGGGAVCTQSQPVGLLPFAVAFALPQGEVLRSAVRSKNCLLPNVAKITEAAPGTTRTAIRRRHRGATAKVPAWFCHQPPPEPTDLQLSKSARSLNVTSRAPANGVALGRSS